MNHIPAAANAPRTSFVVEPLFSRHKKHKKPQNGPDTNGLLKSTSTPFKAGSAAGMVRKLMFPAEQK